jgi:hypothetical protein
MSKSFDIPSLNDLNLIVLIVVNFILTILFLLLFDGQKEKVDEIDKRKLVIDSQLRMIFEVKLVEIFGCRFVAQIKKL